MQKLAHAKIANFEIPNLRLDGAPPMGVFLFGKLAWPHVGAPMEGARAKFRNSLY